MNYLTNYLKTIPNYDVQQIQQALKNNQLNFGLDEANQKEFQRLVTQITEENEPMTQVPFLGDKIEAAPLNHFYSSVEVDLSHLFAEQSSVEVAAENYHHIYKDVLEDLTRSTNNLRRAIEQLDRQSSGEKGLVLKEYSFEPEQEVNLTETYTPETAYLFVDRNAVPLQRPEISRLYHNYSLTLSKRTEANAILDSNNITQATLEVLYQTPGTLDNHNPTYTIDKAIDGSSDSFWFNVNLKASNGLDKIDISPKGWG